MNGEFLVTRGDTPELFKTIEKSLNQIARFITMSIIGTGRFSIRARRDNRFGVTCFNLLHQGITVIAFVCNHGLGIGRHVEQGGRLADVSLFGAGQGEPDPWLCQEEDP